ncbi:MAG: hypothetical protein EOO14_07940 [Chitinophagaceae bacterium]|nr:MAG: hypothetical protein EOO14_07940 [Chitinophagaceae bacterium]
MKKIPFFLLGWMVFQTSRAQVVNNGGNIVVQQGAVLFCSGNLTNTAGNLNNNGKVEVQGSFLNSALYSSSTNDDSLILSGGGNVLLTAGNTSIHYLQINKAGVTNRVTLGTSVNVTSKFEFLQGELSTDFANNPSFVFSAPATATFTFAAGREIAGKVKRTGWTNGSSRTFNSANMQVQTNSGTAPTEMTVLVLPQTFGGDPSQAEREVKRRFSFAHTGGSGFTADIRFPFQDAELNTNTEANLVPWYLSASEWNAKLTPVTRDVSGNWVSTTGIPTSLLSQEWKLADPLYTFTVAALLRGAWNGTDLNTSMQAILPKTQPYAMTPFQYAGSETVSSIPANVVDWVLVELRKPGSGAPGDANAASIIGRAAAFLKNDGSIVGLDGTSPFQFNISKQGPSFITVRHRNHLGVMSNVIPSNAAGTFANNFTVLSNVYKNSAVSAQPVVLLQGSTKYGMWSGDANRSGNLAASDIATIRSTIANGMTGYQHADVNMTGNLAASDVALVKAMIAQGAQGSAPARTTGTAGKVRSHLPDPITD